MQLELLHNPQAAAVSLVSVLNTALGDWLSWEPESTWKELEHRGIDVPTANRAKIMAAQTLHLVPSFYWDGIVFEKTAVAFDGRLPHPDILEEASPALLAWAVVEAQWILNRAHEPAWTFEHEPCAYAGVILARAGFVLAPEHLSFAQPLLDTMHCHAELRDEVAARWRQLSPQDLSRIPFAETPVDVQIARLAAVALHIAERRTAAERELTSLR